MLLTNSLNINDIKQTNNDLKKLKSVITLVSFDSF